MTRATVTSITTRQAQRHETAWKDAATAGQYDLLVKRVPGRGYYVRSSTRPNVWHQCTGKLVFDEAGEYTLLVACSCAAGTHWLLCRHAHVLMAMHGVWAGLPIMPARRHPLGRTMDVRDLTTAHEPETAPLWTAQQHERLTRVLQGRAS